ncbi:MAG: M16 family metallopeptidase [Chitinophagales bacterium]
MTNRTIAPQINNITHISVPKIEKYTLGNGLPVYTINGSSSPIVKLELFFQAGRYFETKPLVSALTAGMLNKGTSNKTAFEIVKKIDFYGAHISFSANTYTASITISCLKEYLGEILAILEEILLDATFPEEEFVQLRERAIQKLKINQLKNGYIASKHFNAALFGKNHPCGYLTTEETYRNIQIEDVKDYYKSHFSFQDFSFLIAAGNIDKDVITCIDKKLSSIPVNQNFVTEQKTFSPEKNKTQEIKIADSVQASIRVGKTLFDVHHPDYKEINILNTVLGGYFGSRLMSNIREEKGYTYGIYSFISPIIDTSYFCIATDVGLAHKEATLHEISYEINRLKNEAVGQEELDMVKNYLAGQLMKSVDGSMKIASTLRQMIIFGQDINDINEDLRVIQDVSAEQLMQLANKYLDMNEMYKVVAA